MIRSMAAPASGTKPGNDRNEWLRLLLQHRSTTWTPAARSASAEAHPLVAQRIESRRHDHRRREAGQVRGQGGAEQRVGAVESLGQVVALEPVHQLLVEGERIGARHHRPVVGGRVDI